MDAAAIVDRQVTAYNRRDAAEFAGCYAHDASVESADGAAMMTGREQIAASYEPFFARNPALHVAVHKRITLGEVVVDEELVTGLTDADGGPELHAVAVYQVRSGQIQRVQLFT